MSGQSRHWPKSGYIPKPMIYNNYGRSKSRYFKAHACPTHAPCGIPIHDPLLFPFFLLSLHVFSVVSVKSIEDLSTIFKELAVLVIDQGTILDRIDFNMEQVGLFVLSTDM